MTKSHSGNHYDPGDSDIMVFMNVSNDNGRTWQNVAKNSPFYQYKGGVSEVGIAVSPLDGNMYLVMRNEDFMIRAVLDQE
jgi:Neuraminidase (sialidase)